MMNKFIKIGKRVVNTEYITIIESVEELTTMLGNEPPIPYFNFRIKLLNREEIVVSQSDSKENQSLLNKMEMFKQNGVKGVIWASEYSKLRKERKEEIESLRKSLISRISGFDYVELRVFEI